MELIEQVAEYFQSTVGEKKEEYLGSVTALMIQRYALAVGEVNPLYFDKAYAQEKGYRDIIAPPNMLPSIVEWKEGASECDLRPDGIKEGTRLPPQFEGVRIMGGGERMDFYRPVVAGTHISLFQEVTDAYMKYGKKGPLAFSVQTNTFKDGEGNVLCISKRTVIAR